MRNTWVVFAFLAVSPNSLKYSHNADTSKGGWIVEGIVVILAVCGLYVWLGQRPSEDESENVDE